MIIQFWFQWRLGSNVCGLHTGVPGAERGVCGDTSRPPASLLLPHVRRGRLQKVQEQEKEQEKGWIQKGLSHWLVSFQSSYQDDPRDLWRHACIFYVIVFNDCRAFMAVTTTQQQWSFAFCRIRPDMFHLSLKSAILNTILMNEQKSFLNFHTFVYTYDTISIYNTKKKKSTKLFKFE